MSSLLSGQAIGGTIASIISITFLAVGGSDATAALFSFSFAAVFLSTVVVLFWYVSRQEFYRSYAEDQVQPTSSKPEPAKEINMRKVVSQTWLFHLAAFLNFLVTLAIFPTWFSLAETTSSNEVSSEIFYEIFPLLWPGLAEIFRPRGRLLHLQPVRPAGEDHGWPDQVAGALQGRQPRHLPPLPGQAGLHPSPPVLQHQPGQQTSHPGRLPVRRRLHQSQRPLLSQQRLHRQHLHDVREARNTRENFLKAPVEG